MSQPIVNEPEAKDEPKPPKEPSKYSFTLLVEPEKPELDIIFIHGFKGHPKRTWTSKHDEEDGPRLSKIRRLIASSSAKPSGTRREVFWPRDLLPCSLPHARILTYGYDTNIRHKIIGQPVSNSTIYDIAWDLLVELETYSGEGPPRPLIFVAHSLGGIIVKECLRRSQGCRVSQPHLRTIYENTSGIVFFGTPHGGAGLQGNIPYLTKRILKVAGFTVNQQVLHSLMPNSERLKELRDEFGQLVREKGIVIHSFQEKYGVKVLNGAMVVEDVASCLGDPAIEIVQRINSNHMDMCRFCSLEDSEYKKVVAALSHISKATDQLKKVALEQHPTDLLDRLNFEQIGSRLTTVRVAQPRTCEWLLKMPEYQDWCSTAKTPGHREFLWIKGKPGAGKSTIMRFLHDTALKEMTDVIVVSFFFNARGVVLEKTMEGMYRALLFQIFKNAPDLLEHIFQMLPIYQKVAMGAKPTKDHIFEWQLEFLKTIFSATVVNLREKRLACFIDALDECDEFQVRDLVVFFRHLSQSLLSSQVHFKVCFSSRHYPNISIQDGLSLVLENQYGHEKDIDSYLDSELRAGSDKRAQKIKEEIRKRASGVFLWVVLVVQILNREYDKGRIGAVEVKLKMIPDGLHRLFLEILTRDTENIKELAICLQWLLYSQRPLTTQEFFYAILTNFGVEHILSWDLQELTEQDMERYILDSSKGLAEVNKSGHRRVQFVHESVRDFLVDDRGMDKIQEVLSVNLGGSSHDRLKRCCEIYIANFPSNQMTEDLSLLPEFSEEEFPFLSYAINYILYHADAAAEHGISQITFLSNFPTDFWVYIHSHINIKHRDRLHCTPRVNLLYILADEGYSHLVEIERKRIGRIDIEGGLHRFPIIASAAGRHVKAMKALLGPRNSLLDNHFDYENGIFALVRNVPRFGGDFNGILDKVIGCNDVAALMVLIVSIDMSLHGVTMLYEAAACGHKTIAKILINVGVDPISALLLAARNGQREGFKLLIEIGNDLRLEHRQGRDLLFEAVQGGNVMILKIILENVIMGIGDGYAKWKTLSEKFKSMHEAVIILLLQNDPYLDIEESYLGQTLLSRAAAHGFTEAVVLLLSMGADLEPRDTKYGQTPLSWAAENGHVTVIQLLLDKGANLESRDDYNRTPLLWAAVNGHAAVVDLFLKSGAYLEPMDTKYGQTALSWAAENGHAPVVQLLLENGANPESSDYEKRTPLSRAAENHHTAVLQHLLDKHAER